MNDKNRELLVTINGEVMTIEERNYLFAHDKTTPASASVVIDEQTENIDEPTVE